MKEAILREQRKLDHINYALELGDGGRKTGLEDIRFLHNCLTSAAPEQVDLRTHIGGISLPVPIFIDAITGGTERVKEINQALARIAGRTGIAMAVGSQYGAVRGHADPDSYTVVRRENPEGIFFANISALATPAEAEQAIGMIGACALEIHLNAAQELLMPEGDRAFDKVRENLCHLRETLTIPLIVKETGCGMAKEQIRELQALGFTCFDTAGLGGTSFAAIEAARGGNRRHEKFSRWGIPTAWSLLDAVRILGPWDTLIASGGIRSGWQTAQALAIGADAVSMSGNVLTLLLREGENAVVAYIEEVIADLRDIMVLTGSKTIWDLQQVPLIFTGETLDFLQSRGYDPGQKRRNNPIKTV